MLDFVKQLFEQNVISEDTKSEIENAWQQRIQENREQVTEELRESITAQLREEFAQKYEFDKSAMVTAVENMLADRLEAEISEFMTERNGLLETRANYVRKMKQDTETMESFVLSLLKKELSELHEDRKAVANNVAKLETFIVDSLAKEITDFYQDKRDLAETKVKLIKESRNKFEQLKQSFIRKSARLVETTVTSGIHREMTQLREDIEQARKNDFGRRIFESFASEYAASHLNEKTETAKLLKVLKQRDMELNEAAKIVADKQKILESKETELRIARDLSQRKEIMGELLGPLSGDKKQVMKELLESVQTDRLYAAFDKYLPAVMDNVAAPTRKSTLVESKVVVTGNKQVNNVNSDETIEEIFDIRRLAGLKA